MPPPYEQVRAQIAEQARSGALPVGYRLPTVRGLAETLGLAANTVAKAYRALEARRGDRDAGAQRHVRGCRGLGGGAGAAAGRAGVRRAGRRLGLGEDAALAAVRDALRAAYGE